MSIEHMRSIPATIHGRVLIREAAEPAGILAGFHGYMENAALQMARLAAIPGSGAWTLIAIQGLHRFYKGRSEDVVASWMTREDRDTMIADNIQYVDAALATLAPAPDLPIVCCGFSQGAAMAYRAAGRGRFGAVAVIAVGGDVPPELAADPAARFPPVLMVRGERDEWFTQAKLDTDAALLRDRGVRVQALVVEGAHEWTADVAAAAGGVLRGF